MLDKETEFDLMVYYAMLPDETEQGEGFGHKFKWDQPLLEGYPWTLLENKARRRSTDSFFGCKARALPATLRADSVDVAIVTGWHSLFLVQGIWACRRLGIPVIVRGESNTFRRRGFVKAWAQRRLIRSFAAFLAIGESNGTLYRNAGVPAERIFPCFYCVDNERFCEQANHLRKQRAALRARWGIPDDAACFLFAGKFVHKKRIMDFVHSISEVAKKKRIFGLMVGSGPRMPEIQDFVSRSGAPVRLAGFLNQGEMAAAYAAADCLVLPSDYRETWGLVVNEAMACGTPAIVSDEVGCGPDLVIEGVTGSRFTCGDVESLQSSIDRFADERVQLATMGEQACAHVCANYSISLAVEGVRSAVEYLVNKTTDDKLMHFETNLHADA